MFFFFTPLNTELSCFCFWQLIVDIQINVWKFQFKFDLLSLVCWTQILRVGTVSTYLNFFPVVRDEADLSKLWVLKLVSGDLLKQNKTGVDKRLLIKLKIQLMWFFPEAWDENQCWAFKKYQEREQWICFCYSGQEEKRFTVPTHLHHTTILKWCL